MSNRITRKMVEQTFEHFVKYMELPAKNDTNAAYVELDHYNPGGNSKVWRMVLVHADNGGHSHLFGDGRMTSEQIYEAMHFAMNVKQYQDRSK